VAAQPFQGPAPRGWRRSAGVTQNERKRKNEWKNPVTFVKQGRLADFLNRDFCRPPDSADWFRLTYPCRNDPGAGDVFGARQGGGPGAIGLIAGSQFRPFVLSITGAKAIWGGRATPATRLLQLSATGQSLTGRLWPCSGPRGNGAGSLFRRSAAKAALGRMGGDRLSFPPSVLVSLSRARCHLGHLPAGRPQKRWGRSSQRGRSMSGGPNPDHGLKAFQTARRLDQTHSSIRRAAAGRENDGEKKQGTAGLGAPAA